MVNRVREGINPGCPNPALGGRERSGGKRRQLLAQRAVQRGRRRHRRKNRRFPAFRHLTRDQPEVARRLSVRRVDLVSVTGWSFVASFLAFLDQLEYFVLLDLEGQGFVRVMIPIARLILTYQLKILLGIPLVTKTTKRVTKDKQVVEVEEHVFGFQVFVVYEVHLRLIVAAKVVPSEERETRHTLALVRQALHNLGPGILRVLLVDRGFLDGADLWELKHTRGIDFVVPAKAKMRITTDAQGLARQQADGESIFRAEREGTPKAGNSGREWRDGQVTVVGVAHLTSYDQ